MKVEVTDEEPTSGNARYRTLDEQVSQSVAMDTREAPQVVVRTGEASVVPKNAPIANDVSRGLSTTAQASLSSSSASSSADGYTEELDEDLTKLIADGVDRAISELQCIKSESASAMESSVKEERSTFDDDVTEDVEGSEELMEMESFEYDEELPHTDGADSSTAAKHVKGRNGVDYIVHNRFRYSYQRTLLRSGLQFRSGSRHYRCVMRGGASFNCKASLYEDPVSGNVTLSGEHVHDTKSGKTGLIATCNGYRMRSVHANTKGELYWVCARQTQLKCSGAAKSGLDAGELVETREHNHDMNSGRSARVKASGVSTTVNGDGPRRKGDRRAKADALNVLANTDSPPPLDERSVPRAAPATRRQPGSTANSVDSLPMVQANESSRTSDTSTITATTSGSTSANKPNPTMAESGSVWNFKSREAMQSADVVLHLRDTKLYAHKAILSAISPAFDKALRQSVGPTAVHSVDPSDVGPTGLEAFLHSIYPCGSEPTEDALPQVTILAYRYGIRPLLRKCLERVKHSSTLSKLDKLMVAVKITATELEDAVIASFTKDDINQLLQSDLQHQLGEGRLLKLLAKSISL